MICTRFFPNDLILDSETFSNGQPIPVDEVWHKIFNNRCRIKLRFNFNFKSEYIMNPNVVYFLISIVLLCILMKSVFSVTAILSIPTTYLLTLDVEIIVASTLLVLAWSYSLVVFILKANPDEFKFNKTISRG